LFLSYKILNIFDNRVNFKLVSVISNWLLFLETIYFGFQVDEFRRVIRRNGVILVKSSLLISSVVSNINIMRTNILTNQFTKISTSTIISLIMQYLLFPLTTVMFNILEIIAYKLLIIIIVVIFIIIEPYNKPNPIFDRWLHTFHDLFFLEIYSIAVLIKHDFIFGSSILAVMHAF